MYHVHPRTMFRDVGSPGERATASPSDANNQWSAAMFPLAEQLFMLQTNLLFDIAAHEVVQNVEAASTRILVVSENWKTWIARNTYKAQVASSIQTSHTLGWRVDRPTKWTDDLRQFYGIQRMQNCSVGGMDACELMKCKPRNSKTAGCHKSGDPRKWNKAWCGDSSCYNANALFFHWQYLAPRSEKLKFQVEKMISTLEMKGFEKMGRGYCSSTRYAFSEEDDEKACAVKCRSEEKCNFFTYRPSNKICSRYSSSTCDLINPNYDHVTYRPGTAGFEYVESGICSSSRYRDWNVNQVKNKEHCARNCRALRKCKFFTWRAEPEACILFASETCTLTRTGESFETYRRGISQAESTGKPITKANLKHKFRGRCKGDEGMFANGGHGELFHDESDLDRPEAQWSTDRYYSMVVQAWIRCFTRDSRTKYVSVWKDGGYRCFKNENKCEQQDDPGTRTYELQNWGPFN